MRGEERGGGGGSQDPPAHKSNTGASQDTPHWPIRFEYPSAGATFPERVQTHTFTRTHTHTDGATSCRGRNAPATNRRGSSASVNGLASAFFITRKTFSIPCAASFRRECRLGPGAAAGVELSLIQPGTSAPSGPSEAAITGNKQSSAAARGLDEVKSRPGCSSHLETEKPWPPNR